MTAPIPCLVSDNGTWASVAGVQLGSAEVEDLIWRLAACRQVMAPRRRAVMFEGSRIAVGDGWKRMPDGMVVVHHPGVGWIGAIKRSPRPAVPPATEALRDGPPAPPA